MTTQLLERMSCPSCGADGRTKKRNTFNVLRCYECELEYVPVDGHEIVKANPTNPDFYQMTIADYDLHVGVARKKLKRRLREYETLLGRSPANVLEIGCGSGAYATAFQEHGVAYTSIEIDPVMANFARTRTGADIRAGDFVAATGLEKDDVIFCSQVLEHVPNPMQFLRRARALARIVHLDIPNHDGAAALYRRFRSTNCYGAIEPPHHLLGYNRHALGSALQRAGLLPVVLRSFRTDHAIWGTLYAGTSLKMQLYYAACQVLDRASLLTAVAIPTNHSSVE